MRQKSYIDQLSYDITVRNQAVLTPARYLNFMKIALSLLLLSSLLLSSLAAQNASFHNAPATAKAQKNPFAGQSQAVTAGREVYGRTCIA